MIMGCILIISRPYSQLSMLYNVLIEKIREPRDPDEAKNRDT